MNQSNHQAPPIRRRRFCRVRNRRPTIAMVAGVIFAMLGLWTMISGALLEGAGVMMVGLGCTSIGLNPFHRDSSSDF